MAKRIESNSPHTDSDFKGYTLDELRYQRALLALRSEYCKERIYESFEKVHKLSPFSDEGKKGLGKNIGGIVGKVVTGLSYVDYAMIGFSVFSTIRKFTSLFRRKK